MAKVKPILYLFYGDDEFGISQEIAGIKSRLGDAATIEMNTTTLHGGTFTLQELAGVATTTPFLAERRLIILTNLLAGLNDAKKRAQFKEIVKGLPQETALVLVVPVNLKADHWLLEFARERKGKAFIRLKATPRGREMPPWILARAKIEGGEFTHEAATLLAELVHDNPRLAVNEIKKMVAYVNYARPVDEADVEHVFARLDQEHPYQIFDLVDAVGNRDGKKAQKLYQSLLVHRDPVEIFFMIVRQFRILLVTRETLDLGGDLDGVWNNLKMVLGKPRLGMFIARKAVTQAQNFSLQQLIDIYHHLLALDEKIKMGEINADVGLDLLITSLTMPVSASTR